MKIEIFEPSLCCPTGLCGPEPDKSLIDLQNTIQILGKASVKVNRYAINQAPTEFMRNKEVRDFIIKSGPGKLPVTLLDGKIIKTENYASLHELAVHIPEIKNFKPDQKIIGIFS